MKTTLGRCFAMVLALSVLGGPVAAQLAANPVYLSPKGPNGLTLAFDFGTTVANGANKPNNVGGRAILGLPFIKLGVTGGLLNPDDGSDKEFQFGATAAITLFSPPLVPVGITAQAGAAYLSQAGGAIKTFNVPLAIGVGVKPPTPGLSVELWGAPRFQITRIQVTGLAGSSSDTKTGVGASGGINLGVPSGLGLHAALDLLNMNSATTVVLGIGLHYTFSLPGIPLVPVL